MSQSKGLVAVYRWKVADEHKSAFRKRWQKATHELRDLGGLGSVLGEDSEGNFVAVALWRDAESRKRAFSKSANNESWPPAQRLDPLLVDVTDDLWSVSPFKMSK